MGAQTDRPPNEHPIILRLYGEIWPTTNVFQAGQQIRIDISTSDFPHFLPSLVPSENEILHDQDHPSRLILPVEPASVFRYLNEIACLNYQRRVCYFSYDSESVASRNRCHVVSKPENHASYHCDQPSEIEKNGPELKIT